MDSKSQKRPVISAKDAINAMRSQHSQSSHSAPITSAREAVNAAAKQSGAKRTRSASNLHHGSIQRSMESTRTSASAILRSSRDENVPIVRTSLKLGTSARPKPAPVILPAHARMAQSARPIGSSAGKKSKLLRHGAIDAQIISAPRSLGSKTPRLDASSKTPSTKALPDKSSASKATGSYDKSSTELAVTVIPSSAKSALGDGSAVKPATRLAAGPVSSPAGVRRKVSPINDPQMLSSARPASTSHAQGLMSSAQTAEVLGMSTGNSMRFRAKPKDFSAHQPAAMSSSNSYVISEPPKLTPKKTAEVPHVPLDTDKPELPAIKADNTSNYSFSQKKASSSDNRYTLNGESPFLKSVNVEKRPLSNSPQKFNPRIERSIMTMHVPEPTKTSKPPKSSRKNKYPKKPAANPAPGTLHTELPQRPVVIVPSNRRSKSPLVFLILLTIILGAAVGAAVYLCFFQ